MIKFDLKNLLHKKAFSDKRKYTYYDIEKDTGIKYVTLSRINTIPDYNIKTTDLEKLCRYFNCRPNDLIKIYDEVNPKEFTPHKPNEIPNK